MRNVGGLCVETGIPEAAAAGDKRSMNDVHDMGGVLRKWHENCRQVSQFQKNESSIGNSE